MYKTLSPHAIGFPVSFKDAVSIAGKNGFEGYWFNIKEDSQIGVSAARELLNANNIIPAGFSLPVEFRRDEELFNEDIKKLTSFARFAKELGMDRCITWLVPASDDLTYKDNFELHRRRLKKAAQILEEYGIRLGLEFVGPPLLRKGKKYEFIHNLDQIMELCNAIGTSNMGLLLDVWHWDMAGQSFEDFKKIPDEKFVVLVHLNDAPEGVPVDEQEDLVRRLPGETGVLKIESFFKGLTDMGYTGPALVEPFSATLKAMKFEDAVAVTKASIDKVWPK